MNRDKIPFTAIAEQLVSIKGELLDAVSRVLDHGQFILGTEVTEFERLFAQLAGTSYAFGVNSGTDALVLALRALGIGPGDEVITAPNSFVASTGCIRIVGATPVLADVGPDYNIDPRRVQEAVTSRTKAILPIHLTGRPANMTELLRIAQQRDLVVIEDCAQAVLAEHRGKRVGSFGHIGCFSLHPLKTLSACGDGGVLTTSDSALAERIGILRNLGLASRDNAVEWSVNSRLDTIQASILLVKLKYVDRWTEARRRNAVMYRELLADLTSVRLPQEEPWEKSVYHTFVVLADRRDDLREHLKSRGIGTAIHYPVPIHLQTIGRTLGYESGRFPVAEYQSKRILSLPIYPELSASDIRDVAAAIRGFFGA